MKKSTTGIILIIGAIATTLTATYFLNFEFKNWATLFYYNLKNDHFNYGDKMYAYQDLFKDKQNQAVPLFRLMRPLSMAELETINKFSRMDINIDKDKFYDSSAKPVMVFCYKLLIEDKMYLQKSALIGNYISSHTEDVLTKDRIRGIKNTFYSFIPDKNVLESDLINYTELPVNFTWVDSSIYILPAQVSKKETLK